MSAPSRPALRWHGGKWRLAPWIIAHFPPHRIYVEPFGGAASVLLRKPRARGEIYNDLDGEVVNLFRVLRSPWESTRLVALLGLTPFARAEFGLCYEPTEDPIEAARRLCVRSFMGFGSNASTTTGEGRAQTGFRGNSNRSGTTPAQDWANYPRILPDIVDRLAGVVIENRDAVRVMAQHDGADTLHYVDPPYLHGLRSLGNPYCRKQMYRHEMSDDEHVALLAALVAMEGMVVLSGYPSPLYDDALPGWRRILTQTMADGARPRTEVLWLNPACQDALDRVHGGADMPLLAAGGAA